MHAIRLIDEFAHVIITRLAINRNRKIYGGMDVCIKVSIKWDELMAHTRSLISQGQ